MNRSQKLIKQVYEMSPQLIPDIDRISLGKHATALYHANRKAYVETDIKGLLFKGDTQNGVYIFVHNDEVEYYVQYKSVSYQKLLAGRMIRQVLVVRNKASVFSAGIAKHVFFDKLLSIYGTLVTDTQQTSDGHAFWQYTVKEALENPANFTVVLLDRRASPNKAISIRTMDELDAYRNIIWGNDKSFQQMLIAISKK